jgi:hypothetical protein
MILIFSHTCRHPVALSSLLLLIGVAALYRAASLGKGGPGASGARPRWASRSLLRGGGTLLLGAAVARAVVEAGWGVGLVSLAARAMLAVGLLALCAPLWPRPTQGLLAATSCALLAAWLGGA